MEVNASEPEARKWPKVLLTTLVVVAALGAVIGVANWVLDVPRGRDVDRITGYNQPSRLLPPNQYGLAIVLAENYHEYRRNSSLWSLAYYGCLFMSAFLSAMAAFVLKVECFPKRPELKKDTAALCSTIAAVLITLITIGNFQQKWQANRLAATAMQNLIYEVWKGDSGDSKANIFSRIEEINLLRNQEIVGGGGTSSAQKGEQKHSGPSPERSNPDDPSKTKQPDKAH